MHNVVEDEAIATNVSAASVVAELFGVVCAGDCVEVDADDIAAFVVVVADVAAFVVVIDAAAKAYQLYKYSMKNKSKRNMDSKTRYFFTLSLGKE